MVETTGAVVPSSGGGRNPRSHQVSGGGERGRNRGDEPFSWSQQVV